MYQWLKAKIEHLLSSSAYVPAGEYKEADEQFGSSLSENLISVRQKLSNTSDLITKRLKVSGIDVCILVCEGLVSTQTFTELVADPITRLNLQTPTPEKLAEWIRYDSVLALEQNETHTFSEMFRFLMSGFVVLLVDGLNFAFVFGIQGYKSRSISEPETEVNVRGSKEAFVEPIRTNISLIRRKLKSPKLKFELSTIGSKSKTDICLVYMTDCVSQKVLDKLKYRLSKVETDVILESGYLTPYLEKKPLSIFSGIGVTERPDTVCAKISEGRVVVLVDGTPFALIAPYLFNEHFQTMDDYVNSSAYATFIRWLKYFAFFISFLLPGLYVAVAAFHPELFPHQLLFNIAASEDVTPFPIMLEALIIHLIFEIMREAGLRLPRPVGHAIGIVGALVIGDAAVTAGLIGSPMVMVVALTTISSFVVSSLYEPITLLRIAFIFIGGMLGVFGIALGLCIVFTNLCAINPFGVPTTAPATPFLIYGIRDTFLRVGWKVLGRKDLRIQDLPGSEIQSRKGGEL